MFELLRTNEFEQWITQLKDQRGRLRILQRIDRLAHGNSGDAKSIGKGLSELRLDVGPGYRVYFLQDGQTIILLLCGGDKSTQRRDIVKARELAEEYLADKQMSSQEDGK